MIPGTKGHPGQSWHCAPSHLPHCWEMPLEEELRVCRMVTPKSTQRWDSNFYAWCYKKQRKMNLSHQNFAKARTQEHGWHSRAQQTNNLPFIVRQNGNRGHKLVPSVFSSLTFLCEGILASVLEDFLLFLYVLYPSSSSLPTENKLTSRCHIAAWSMDTLPHNTAQFKAQCHGCACLLSPWKHY